MTDLRLFVSKQLLTLGREIRVFAPTRAAAGRILKERMGSILEAYDRDALEIVQVSCWWPPGDIDVVPADLELTAPRVLDWHLDTGGPWPRAEANGPSAQRLTDLLTEKFE